MTKWNKIRIRGRAFQYRYVGKRRPGCSRSLDALEVRRFVAKHHKWAVVRSDIRDEIHDATKGGN